MKKFLFILNPIAGHGKAPELEKLIRDYVVPENVQFDIAFTQFAGHGIALTKEAAEKNYYSVVAVGGDGTVNEVARSLTGTSTALGIIPMGSGNGFARHLGYPMDPTVVLPLLINAKIQQSDTISINEYLSLNVSGIGFDGYVAWLFNNSGKRGLSNYTSVALKAYAGYDAITFNFKSEDTIRTITAHMLVIANASQFGNKAIIAPTADIQDGMIDCVFVHKPPFWKLPALFYRLFSGKIKDNAWIQSYKCKSFTVKASRPLHLHIDGESTPLLNELNVHTNPAALNVLIP